METIERVEEIGNTFRMKREEMNLTLKEVENATSIRMNYLQAIEDGKIGQYISAVYALGFIKQYANFLGLNGDKIISENPKAFHLRAEKQEFSYGIGTLESRGSPKSSGRFLPNLMWVGFFSLMLAFAWYFAKFLGVI